MIFIDNTLAPLTVVGVLPEHASVPPELGCDEAKVWSCPLLLLTLVVPGRGASALAAQQELCQWLRARKGLICDRPSACAWVVEDETLRTCIGSCLALTHDAVSGPRTEVFRSIRFALSWLTQKAAVSQ